VPRLILILALLFCLRAAGQSAPEQKAGEHELTTKQTIVNTLPPDKLQPSEALYKLDLKLAILDPVYSLLVLLALLSWGIAARYRDWAESVSRWRFVQALVFVPLLLITIGIADLPLRVYSHHIALKYGLSVQRWGSWFADVGKGETIDIVILIPMLWLMVTIIRKSPRRFWFYFWLIVVPIMVFLAFIWPMFIDPLFNKFEPLEAKNPKLVEEIEKVTQRAGLNIPRSRIYEMKASEKVTTLNAYVSGVGASKRVVVWDTTMQKMTIPETLLVFGHEMGHYVLHHVVYGLVLSAIGLLIGLYIIFRVSGRMLNRFASRWRIRGLDDWTAIPMIFLLAGILGFFAEPLANTVSRHIEHQADIYGLEVTHGINPDSKRVAAQAFQVMGELSLDYPYPNRLAVFWYWSHPPIADRVRFAQEYDPWSKGESPKYVQEH
jgi:STE24 endopeptidase